MPHQSRIVAPGRDDRSGRTATGLFLHPPGDPALTRRVKAAGPTWTLQQKRGCKLFPSGVWANASDTCPDFQSR